MCLLKITGLVAGLLLAPMARAAVASPDAAACSAAIAAAEQAGRLPPQILTAIGVVESGRLDRASGLIRPWPWTIDVAGRGQMFGSPAEAIAAVHAAQAQGVQSIDVGCMQVNLAYHPHAFASLEEAFDPVANVRYAAGFLNRLHGQTGDWGSAIAAYHSANPAFGPAYAQTVAAVWRLGPRYGLTAHGAPGGMSLDDEVDPGRVLTAEFRAQMVAALTFQRQRGSPVAQPVMSLVPARSPTRRPLEAEVDPNHTLTPEFRAQMVAAVAFQRRVEAGFGTVELSRRR